MLNHTFTITKTVGKPYRYLFVFSAKLENYPWIKSVEHLNRVNKYRKRVSQPVLWFDDDDVAELILLKGG